MNELISRLAVGTALAVLALTLMLAGLAFLLLALFLVAARFLGPIAAAGVTGFSAFAAALVLLLIIKHSGARRRKAVAARPALNPAPASVAAGAGELAAVLVEEGRRLLAGHAKGAAVTALAAGVAVGISPRLRRNLWRLLR